ncbi:MAG: hypothetical protein PHS96_02070 [Anaerolineales bacterium]|nr:hypothetical protein [Anaerolineales bacterium]MDD5466570.1 hypothetical protein [Anaerolineales bacterium]
MSQSIDLASLFGAVTKTMTKNKKSLNKADTYNHNHGDNMVEIFRVITEAMETKSDADPADQLAYASQLLRQRSQSGSAQMYAQGLSQASQRFQGQQVTQDNALSLIQSLLGGTPAEATQAQAQPGDLLGSLLSGLTGETGAGEQPGLDMNDLLSAGMAFMNARQRGGSNLESLVQALVSTSQAGRSPHRAQSGALVANTIIQMLGAKQ